MIQKAQMHAAAAGGMLLMPPFSQSSLFDIRMQRMSSPGRAFSPRPTSALPLPSANVSQAPKCPAFELQKIFQKTPIKRPAGADTPLPMPKTPRHTMEDPKPVRKQVYAPMIDRMAAMKPDPRPIMAKPQPQKEQKKPLPRLIAPSSISVTRVGDSAQLPVQQSNRPAVEILKIPSTVPAIDQKQAPKPAQKTNRPPPGTIPLFKIQKLQMGKAISSPPAAIKPKPEESKALDLSLSPTGGSSSKKIDTVIDLTENESTKKPTEERPKPQTTAPTTNPAKSNGTKPTKPVMPGLTALVPKSQDLLKNRGLMRQQNLSVRNVPNPSILAFRNQGQMPSLAKVASSPTSKLNEKVQQLHNMKEQQRQRIAPED